MVARVNGEERSRGNLRDLYFSWERIREHAARNTTLRSGDVLGSGTVGTGCILEHSLAMGRPVAAARRRRRARGRGARNPAQHDRLTRAAAAGARAIAAGEPDPDRPVRGRVARLSPRRSGRRSQGLLPRRGRRCGLRRTATAAFDSCARRRRSGARPAGIAARRDPALAGHATRLELVESRLALATSWPAAGALSTRRRWIARTSDVRGCRSSRSADVSVRSRSAACVASCAPFIVDTIKELSEATRGRADPRSRSTTARRTRRPTGRSRCASRSPAVQAVARDRGSTYAVAARRSVRVPQTDRRLRTRVAALGEAERPRARRLARDDHLLSIRRGRAGDGDRLAVR